MQPTPDNNKVSFESRQPQEVKVDETPRVGIGFYTSLLEQTVLAILRESPQVDGERLFRFMVDRAFEAKRREDGGHHITILEGAFWLRIIQVMNIKDLLGEVSQHLDLMKKFVAARLGLDVERDLAVINRVLEEVMVNCGGMMKVEIAGQRLAVKIALYHKRGSMLAVLKPRGDGKPSRADLRQALEKELGESAEISGLE